MLVLASRSPRRKKLLDLLPISFEVLEVDADERPPRGVAADRAPLLISRRKAERAAEQAPDGAILTADTAVVFQNRLMGKPSDRDDAVRMLNTLQDSDHRIVTGVTVSANGAVASMSCETRVRLRALEDDEISAYVNSGRPMDRAGAYGRQDDDVRPVASVDGCPASVLGLPLCLLPGLFDELDLDLNASSADACSPGGGHCALRRDVESCMEELP